MYPGLLFFFCIFFPPFAQIFTNITPSTITVDSVNHTYTGTLSSSTYSGYKLAANTNKIVSSGNHTLTGYTGNNIALAITGDTVNVTNSKTSTTRTTELQNFIKSNWSQKFWKYAYPGYDYSQNTMGLKNRIFSRYDRDTQTIEVCLTRLTSTISVANDKWDYDYIRYYDSSGYYETDYEKSKEYVKGVRVWWSTNPVFGGGGNLHKVFVERINDDLLWNRYVSNDPDVKYVFDDGYSYHMYKFAGCPCW